MNELIPLEEQELKNRLAWLVWIRTYAILCFVLFVAFIYFVLGIKFQLQRVLEITLIVLLYNLIFKTFNYKIIHQKKDITSRILNRQAIAQSIADLTAIAAIIHYTGGIENPFAFFVIFHLIFSSILLSRKAGLFQCFFSFSLIAGVAILEFLKIIPHYHLNNFLPIELYSKPLYVAGILSSLLLTSLLSILMTQSIVSNLRKREYRIVSLSNEIDNKVNKLEDLNKKMKKVSEDKITYLRKVSHELKSPVSTIESIIESLLSSYYGVVPKYLSPSLETVKKRTASIISLLNDLLTLAKSMEELPEKKPRYIDIVPILEDLSLTYKNLSAHKGIVFRSTFDSDLPHLYTEKGEFYQVLDNLLSNAVKYTLKEGEISFKCLKSNGELLISVTDTGIGIDGKDMADIYKEFYRSNEAIKIDRESTGLGLSIVKSICDRFGWQVNLQSKIGKGSTFEIVIPVGEKIAG